jgi:hypothetical protein
MPRVEWAVYAIGLKGVFPERNTRLDSRFYHLIEPRTKSTY